MYTIGDRDIAGSTPVFARDEYDARLAGVRRRMAAQDLELCLISAPENVFYLTGLDHWGYFAPHLLLVPLSGELVLVTRAMERVTVANQVGNARFAGHSDSETAADAALRVVRESGLGATRVGIEAWSAGLPHGLALALRAGLPGTRWRDVSGLVDELRMVKSAAEQAYMREAAHVSDAAAFAALEAIGDGVSEREVAAQAYRAMIGAGGTFPGFGPFIRTAARLGEEHTSWGDDRFVAGEGAFLELAGCVARYHAPLGRLAYVGHAPRAAREMAALCADAFDAVLAALRPGACAREVYAAWQGVVDAAGLAGYRRHHCGYVVGIGCPPSWTGGNRVLGLRHDSALEIRTGMTFHILSWLMGTGRGDFFVSDTVLLGADGPEVLTRTPAAVTVP